MVYRIYVEKKPPYAVEAKGLCNELRSVLGITGLNNLRIIQCYDVEGIDEKLFETCKTTVFSEPPVDDILPQLPDGGHVFGVEFLPGQFDQRADSAAECIQLISMGDRPVVSSIKIYVLDGNFDTAQIGQIEKYLINPVEARKASLAPKTTLKTDYPVPQDVEILDGFTNMTGDQIVACLEKYALAMDEADLQVCIDYFKSENRQPTLTELRMLDTYWSDHCRHTTFLTVLDDVKIEDEKTRLSYEVYKKLRDELYKGRTDKPICLMDIATIGTKALKAKGGLKNLDESEEINACSIKIKVDVSGTEQEWLLMFKNETHNHPTEIEPFGGAATCIGGAIRDPLSGRSYVYQAMRVTGAADPLAPISETLTGKLPQSKLVTTAAAGYSSYGNQIGLATGQVNEIYHPGYMAKRLEIGAVVGATPIDNVRRECPDAGDIVILLGGKTGRDGCGGATGSSKAHKLESLEECGAEVQKGNAPVERKLQRLFRNPDVTTLVRRCNDFGAGGVSVAIGELADGLRIDLDAVPKKYEGLDGTELAISESQERMAVVVRPQDVDKFIALAAKENLEATKVAVVTEEKRLVMTWRGQVIVDICRDFLNSNGAEKYATAAVKPLPCPKTATPNGKSIREKLELLADDLNFCSQKGLSERFDSTIGAATVLMPFGGRNQLTAPQAMVAKLPVDSETTTCSGMAYGFDPFISQQNPYTGAYLAVTESLSRLVATGFKLEDAYLTFQEYFPRLYKDENRWGMPLSSLLGALQAQLDFGIAAIGGKDSMSGSFEELDVPPTLVSFAVAPGKSGNIISPEFKTTSSSIATLKCELTDGITPAYESLKKLSHEIHQLILDKKIISAFACGRGGIAEALFKMSVGNGIGFESADSFDTSTMFDPAYGTFVVELAENVNVGTVIGHTTENHTFTASGESFVLSDIQEKWEAKLEPVFPYRTPSDDYKPEKIQFVSTNRVTPQIGVAKPKALIPVFPGTNCEYDTARAVRRAGGDAEIYVIRNLSPADVANSAREIASIIDKCQMIILPGGFSGGDEPEGSAKLINAFFRGGEVSEAVMRLLKQRDGLMLGICNGFQALIKLGLVPNGEISTPDENAPTLTFNTIGRHQSMLVNTVVSSNLSPWLMHETPGETHTIAISHGEGRFVATPEVIASLRSNGQIATQYVDLNGSPTMDVRYNPNGSLLAIEGITSPDGRVLGKMGHTERSGNDLYKNVAGNKYQKLFEGGVDYFRI